jgi:hypothetical protein
MIGLKTLKDLDLAGRHCTECGKALCHKDQMNVTVMFSLRLEAIKWIKELSNKRDKCFCLTCHKGSDEYNNLDCSENHWDNTLVTSDLYEPHGTEEAIKWIKHFFNITEEELK